MMNHRRRLERPRGLAPLGHPLSPGGRGLRIKQMKIGTAWHVHHHLLWERLWRGRITERRGYIRTDKHASEKRLRLELLHRTKKDPFDLSRTAIKALHKKECPDCPWSDRRYTIFTHQDKNG